MKVYHRGDDGFTDIMGGRLPKDSAPVEFIGEVDEFIAILGIVRSLLNGREELREVHEWIKEVQVKLMRIASYVALGGKGRANTPVSEADVEELEKLANRLWGELSRVTRFIVPSGPLEVTFLNLARAVCRRVERRAVKLLRDAVLDNVTYKYLNRLSDLIFVYSRLVAKKLGINEEYL